MVPASSHRSVERPGIRMLVGEIVRTLRVGGWRLAAIYLVGQLITGAIVAPVVHWLFAESLRAVGLSGLELSGIPRLIDTPLSGLLILVLVLLGFFALSLQFIVMVIAVDQARRGERILSRETGLEVARVARKLVRPSSVLLLPYLFVLLPLGGFGFLSVLSQTITVPSFISGELLKTTAGGIGYTAFLLVILWLNLIFALTVPLFAMTEATAGQAQRRSRRLMRGNRWRLLIVLLLVLIAGAVAGLLLILLVLGPVMLTDAFVPAASAGVAAVMLAIAQVGGMIVVGMGGAAIATVVVALTRAGEPDAATIGPAAIADSPPRRARRLIPAVVMAALLVVLSFLNLPAMRALAETPGTLILAHRGHTANAVENTLSSLRAAREAGADFVEMDVMESSDGRFVVMHDANLARLADQNVDVADLTFDELTALSVHDNAGNSDMIPSLAEYLTVANDIGQPLLIEIKLHGKEQPGLVPRLIAEIEELGLLEENIYHSLDRASIEELKRLRPNLGTGLTMALAGVEVPDTIVDFVVIEEWSLTPTMIASAQDAGLGVMAWTVNNEQRVRDLLRDDIHGIITDHADAGLRARESMSEKSGLADVLWDAVFRYVVIF